MATSNGEQVHAGCADAAALAAVPVGPVNPGSVVSETTTQPVVQDSPDDTTPHLQGALTWHDGGMCVFPAMADGTKRPIGPWTQYQAERPTREQVESWFRTNPNLGVGIICGKASGNLEMLETEGRASDPDSLAAIEDECAKRGVADTWATLLKRGYAESTPSGGIHLLYQITDHEVPGNQKVARRPATTEELATSPQDRVKVLSETRGEGGYVIVAPSSGTVHKTGKPWSVVSGVIGQIPQITWEDRCLIHEAIHAALDQMPAQETRQTPAAPRAQASTPTGGDLRPGDDYNRRESWEPLLESYGWTYGYSDGQEQMWTRPGKSVREGASASLYYEGSDNLYVFSTSTELPTETPLSKFAFYTHMEHRGDFNAAGKALYAKGYGTRTASSSGSDFWDWATEQIGKQAGTGPQDQPGPGQEREQELQENQDQRLFIDVAKLLSDGIPPPPKPEYLTREDGHALFYAEKVNVLFGDPECGKTWIALAAVAEALRKGQRGAVMDLDHNGASEILTRLMLLGAKPADLGNPDRFRLAEPEDPRALMDTVMALVGWKANVVVVDSLGELVPMLGLNSSNPDEYTKAHRATLTRLANSGAAVIAIDHLPKSDEARDRGQTGTMAKKRAINGVSLRVTVKEQFAPGKGGAANMTIEKDRPGGVREHCPTGKNAPAGRFVMSVDLTGATRWTVTQPKLETGSDGVRDADVAELDGMDPPPGSQRDVSKRLGWGSDRAMKALRRWRELQDSASDHDE